MVSCLADLERPQGVALLCGKQSLGIRACLCSSRLVPRLGSVRTRVIRRDIGSSMSSSSGRRPWCVPATPSHMTLRVQAHVPDSRETRSTGAVSGRAVAKPQLCAFSSGGRGGAGAGTPLWKADSPHLNIVSRVPVCPPGEQTAAGLGTSASLLCGPFPLPLPARRLSEKCTFFTYCFC